MNKQKRENKKKIDVVKWGKSLFSRFFGFEEGIDITNDVEVLKRRNIVIKNIILLSNIFYFFLMLIVSIVSTNRNDQIFNWVVTAATFPLTFVINYFLSTLIHKGKSEEGELAKQQIAMYFASVYLFISATLFYLKVHNVVGLETFAYLLFFYVITVISLYQAKRALLNGSLILFSILTIVHFFVTYNSPQIINNGGEQMKLMLVDIGLRSIIFIIYVVVLYAIVSIGEYMHHERVFELQKRRLVETDFHSFSADLINSVLASPKSLFNQRKAYQVHDISIFLGQVSGYNDKELEELKEFSLVHLRTDEIKDSESDEIKGDFNILKQKSELAAIISRRIQLAQKVEDIARAQTEGILSDQMAKDLNRLDEPLESQIILLADLYITMRAVETYKRPLNHAIVMKIFEEEFDIFFSRNLFQRFMAYHNDFAKIYNNFN